MAYATVQDMVKRFGVVEMTRLTTPSDQDMDGIVATVADTALESASAIMDSYIRRRYATPLDLPPTEITDACCDVARFRLSTGDQKSTSEEVRQRHKDAMQWLADIARGVVTLDLDEVSAGDESFAQVSIRAGTPYGGGVF